MNKLFIAETWKNLMEQTHRNLLEQLRTEHAEKEAGSDFMYLMFCMAKGLTQNTVEAEDIVQDTVEIFLTKPPKKSIRYNRGFIYKTIRNRFINIVQSNKRRKAREEKYTRIQELEKDNSTEKENANRYKRMLLLSLRNRLNEKDYHLLELLYSGVSEEEIAEELGVSVKRIKNRRSEILKKLNITSLIILLVLHSIINVQNLIKNLVS